MSSPPLSVTGIKFFQISQKHKQDVTLSLNLNQLNYHLGGNNFLGLFFCAAHWSAAFTGTNREELLWNQVEAGAGIRGETGPAAGEQESGGRQRRPPTQTETNHRGERPH